jgi:hypothetical protein
MTQSELIAAFRSLADDTVETYLWSDDEVRTYLCEAEKEAATRAKLLFDDSSVLYSQVTLAVGQSTYVLNPLVLTVQRVTLAGEKLTKKTKAILDAEIPDWETTTGTPLYYILQDQSIRVVPIPEATGTLHTDVVRLPVIMKERGPEIHSRYHFKLLDWALHLAYSRRDADTFDPIKAMNYESRFTTSFGDSQAANTQRQRLVEGPDRPESGWI